MKITPSGAGIILLQAALFLLPTSMAATPERVFTDSFEDVIPCQTAKPDECQLPVQHFSRVHINEISPAPISRGISDPDGSPPAFPWLELYNGSNSAIELSTLSLRSESQGLNQALPAATFTHASHFTVWFMPGPTSKLDFGLVDDLDMNDGEGHVYVYANGVPEPEGDDIALYKGAEIESFFAYGKPFNSPGALETAAVAAELWSLDDRFDLAANATAGESIGLFVDGFYPGLGPQTPAVPMPATTPASTDFLAVPWVEQTAGIQQPAQAIQVAPRNGQMLTGYPVNLQWRACEGASGYLLALYDSADPAASPVLRVTSTPEYSMLADDINANPVFWTVACMYAGNTSRSIFPPRWNFATGASNGGGDPGSAALSVDHLYQRKDSNMLCLYDAEFGDAYGCKETIAGPEGACNWDAPHSVGSATAVRACGPISENYCARASIKMVHRYLVSNKPISQDYISFLGHQTRNPPGVAIAGDPEGDLGAGAGMTVAQTVDVLSRTLNVASGAITVQNNPSHSDIRGWIDADRPVILFRWWTTKGGHASVVYGYQTTPFNGVFVHDPTDGADLVMRYSHYASVNLRTINPLTAIVAPASAGASPVGDPPNSLHPIANASVFDDTTDQDGIVNFDEIYRFKTAIDNPDSDFDQVGDKQEVYSYTFPKGRRTIVSRPPDIDNDSKRAELDCSTDTKINNDHDGGEDIDGDGGKGEEPTGIGNGESDVFNPADGTRMLSLNKQVFFPGEEVRMTGGTLHGQYAYSVTTLPCPIIPDNTPIGGGGIFNTDILGNGDDVIATCTSPGCFISYVDIADEGVWQETSQKCDTSLGWTCVCNTFDPELDIIDVPLGLAIPAPPPIFDILGIENGTTVGYEVNLTVLTRQLVAATDLFVQFIFEVDAPVGASPSPFPWTEGGALWLDIGFPNLGAPVVQAQFWNPLTNQWQEDTEILGMLQIDLQELAPGEVTVGLVMPGSLDLSDLPAIINITGVRVLTGDQPFTPGAIDVMPEPTAQNPAVYNQFIDLGSCGG